MGTNLEICATILVNLRLYPEFELSMADQTIQSEFGHSICATQNNLGL